MEYALYYSRYCYFCQKVLLALRGGQHSIELRSTSDSEHRQALLRGGGKGQVPCLRITDTQGVQQWLYESDDIIAYIKQHDLVAA